MSIPFRLTPTSVNVMLKGKTYTITEDSHQHYAKIREALKNKDYDTVETLIDLPKAINTFGQGQIRVVDGTVMYGDFEIRNTLTKRILEQMNEGFDVQPMIKFLENLMQNPAKRAVDELFDFLEACDLPITDDGHFIAYKKVRADYKDIYTGKLDNSVGQILTMPRNMVDEEKSRTCSAGLHFCSESYLPCYGSMNASDVRVLLVKINPADVVAIPADYNNAKGRTCRYEVIDEVPVDNIKVKFTSSVYQTTSSADLFASGDYEYTIFAASQKGDELVEDEAMDGRDDAISEADDMINYYDYYHVVVKDSEGNVIFDRINPYYLEGSEREEDDAPVITTAPVAPVIPQAVVPTPAPVVELPKFTKNQLAAMLFGNGSLVHKVDEMVAAGLVEAVTEPSASGATERTMYRMAK